MADLEIVQAGKQSNAVCIKVDQNTNRATYDFALSCWKTAFGRPLRHGSISEHKISDVQ